MVADDIEIRRVGGVECICEWPSHCGGLGMIFCEGCGGDCCVCECGGEAECFGCPERENVSYDETA
jgi:hypothetical protein